MPINHIIQTRLSPSAHTPKMKTFKNVSVYDLLPAMEATDQSDSDENPAMLDYAGDSALSIVKEWIEETFDLDEVDRGEIEDAVQDGILQAVEENVSHSMFQKVLDSVRYALEQSFEAAEVGCDIEVDRKKGFLTISVNPNDLMRAWRTEVEGMGYAAWGGDESIGDIKSLVTVIGILDRHAEVFGHHSLRSYYDDSFDRFDPDTGDYSTLSTLADKLWKKHLREKHKTGTKHRR